MFFLFVTPWNRKIELFHYFRLRPFFSFADMGCLEQLRNWAMASYKFLPIARIGGHLIPISLGFMNLYDGRYIDILN